MNTKRTLPIILLLTAVLLFAGCAGEPSPTPEVPTAEVATATTDSSVIPTEAPQTLPTAEATRFSIFPTIEIVANPTIVVTPFPTRDPAITPDPTEELISPPNGFDRIILIRTGGEQFADGTNTDEIIVINRLDSSVTRGNNKAALTASTATYLAELVDATKFFTVEGTFLGAVPAEPPFPFLYSITVTIGVSERTINAQDGFMSPEIQSLVGAVLTEGQRVPKP